MTPHELGLMTKQAISVKLLRRVANEANRAGKFSGYPAGSKRLHKFQDKIMKWAPGARIRAGRAFKDAGKKLPVHLSMQRTAKTQKPWYNFWSAPTKNTDRTMNSRTLDKMHKAFGGAEKGTTHIKPEVHLGQGDRGFFGHPDYVLAPRNNTATLMHELGHAYTAPKIHSNWRHAADAAGHKLQDAEPRTLQHVSERSRLVLEASANRRAIRSLRKLQGQMPGIPSVKEYRDFARPQYEGYSIKAIQDFVNQATPSSAIPEWIRRMGLVRKLPTALP
jgi:hypothetical protein